MKFHTVTMSLLSCWRPLALGLLFGLAPATLVAQNLYSLDHLIAGPLNGQDNWIASDGAVIEQGVGINTSLVFNNNTNNLPQAAASRTNDAAFSFPTFTFGMTNAVLGFDFRVADVLGDNSKADLLLAHRDHGFTDQGKIGLRYTGKLQQLGIIRADGAGYAGTATNFSDAPGDWFRVRLVVDFTRYGANGSGSLYVRNLTAGEAVYSPVAYLQNVSLLILNQGADPSGWDRLDARACNTQLDNFFVGFTTNTSPELAPLSNRAVPEGSSLTFTATATDADSPAQNLRFALGAGSPPNATITPDGNFSWTPSEAQGPGSYFIWVKVTDSGLPPLSATNRITVTVQEVNTAPALNTIADRTVNEDCALTFQATATDADLPAQTLTFGLGPNAPEGASITPEGDFAWTPRLGHWPATNLLQVTVTDNGTPTLSATQSFTVVVNHLPMPASPTLERPRSGGVRVRETVLLGTDPDGDPVFLSGVDAVSAQGGTVSVSQGWLQYTPPTDGALPDSFGYTVGDGRGGFAAGTATVVLAPNLDPSLNVTWENLTNLQVLLKGRGVPERTYTVEFTENLAMPTWQFLGTVQADALGFFEYLDRLTTGTPGRFYRTVCP